MKISRYIPSDTLTPYGYEYLPIESAVGMENRLLPRTSLVMAFVLGEFLR